MSSQILQGLTLAFVENWLITLSLVFGGCCSNAITLEQITSDYPNSGTLITFFQFLLISLHGLSKNIKFSPAYQSEPKRWIKRLPLPGFLPTKVPVRAYLIQVSLFFAISLLNNLAFGYRVPMSVNIIFRSGGLVVNMVLSSFIGKRYTPAQIFFVILVTFGVFLTTASAQTKPSSADHSGSSYSYAIGITILSLALVFSGALGLVQDRTYERYGRPNLSSSDSKPPVKGATNGEVKSAKATNTGTQQKPVRAEWQESMFFLHFLGLPMFYFVRQDIATQYEAINTGPTINISAARFLDIIPKSSTIFDSQLSKLNVRIPSVYISLLLNTTTQLLCVAGVHRLTTAVSSLNVALILVVRKALSLIISVLFIKSGQSGDMRMMWSGAGLVLAGTIGYTLASQSNKEEKAQLVRKQVGKKRYRKGKGWRKTKTD